MTRDTRASERYQVQLAVTIAAGERQFNTETGDVSLGGAFIVLGEKLPLGSKLDLRITLPSQKEPIQVGATVRWHDSVGIGVQFDGLRARDVWALGRYFESLG